MRNLVPLKVLHWIALRRPCAVIDIDGKPYMERFHLIRIFEIEFMLHRLLAADPEGRSLHNHPWKWARSICLYGCYVEERLELPTSYIDITPLEAANFIRRYTHHISVTRRNILREATFHRITSLFCPKYAPTEVWTLFWHPAWIRPWGFLSDFGFEIASEEKTDHARVDRIFPWWKRVKKGKELMVGYGR